MQGFFFAPNFVKKIRLKSFRHHKPRPKKNSLIVGKAAIINALKEGKALERIFVQRELNSAETEKVMSLAKNSQVPVNKVPAEKLNGMNVTGHEGFIALISKVKYFDVQQIIDYVVEKGEAPLFIILDGITDVRNIGGIARSAYSMGVHAIIIPDKGVGALNDDAILTSAGALENLPVCRVNSLMKTVDDLHLNGIKVCATEMKAQKNISECNFAEPVAIVMGAEEKGIFPALLKICDEKCKIPMAGNFDSLNVSVATGIILYEVLKQRSNG